ncbi:MAG TPA: DUF2752 domain-containing protein [Terriglobia bacterium]|nr:DUF2752 domain-containing protein [Terriglobia bacterium]
MLARGIARLPLLLAAVVAFCLIPPEIFARGPHLCVWSWLFHLQACPACGSTRALAAFFHGQFARALAFNHNVIVTAPLLLGLTALDGLRFLRRVFGSRLAA